MRRIAILASGSGTTAVAFIRAAHLGLVPAKVVVLICNNPKAAILDRVARLNKEYGLYIRTEVINRRTHPGVVAGKGGLSDAESMAICEVLARERVDLVLLLGYMKKITGPLIDKWGYNPKVGLSGARMLNTHPGPLPQSGGNYGIHIQESILEEGFPYSAHAVHAVAVEYDDGPVIAEHRVPVMPGDTPETLFDAVQTAEKTHIIMVVKSHLLQLK